jgi:dUTP pyrophosphatase
MLVKIKKLHPNAVIPKQATELAGGWDVTVTEIEKIEYDLVICKLGFALQLPKNHRLILVPRSSLTKTKWVLQNSPGLGDEDFLQEYQFRFRAIPEDINVFSDGAAAYGSLNYPKFPYKVGDRIGQVYLEEVIPMEFEIVEEFDVTNDRGGYGSTGN